MQSAKGTFVVEMQKQPNGPVVGLTRYRMDKVWQGEFVGTSHGEMLAGGDPAKGEAGYVAMERLDAGIAAAKRTGNQHALAEMDAMRAELD